MISRDAHPSGIITGDDLTPLARSPSNTTLMTLRIQQGVGWCG
jgi:hypothetical protein